jgi:hypothetical protein
MGWSGRRWQIKTSSPRKMSAAATKRTVFAPF